MNVLVFNHTLFYTVGGRRKLSYVGKHSKSMKVLKTFDFRIHTLYLGESRREPLSVVFYDKETEQIERKDSASTTKSRIEICFNCGIENVVPHKLIESIIRSYYNENGNGFRIRVFLHFLSNTVRFTTHVRDQGHNDISNWWKHQVLIPLYHVTFDTLYF